MVPSMQQAGLVGLKNGRKKLVVAPAKITPEEGLPGYKDLRKKAPRSRGVSPFFLSDQDISGRSFLSNLEIFTWRERYCAAMEFGSLLILL